jgi:hypothetical protein
VTANITDVDKGLLHRLTVLEEFSKWYVVVGILDDGKANDPKRQDPELTVLFVASIHEFGAPAAGIPERSIVRAYVDEHEAQIRGWQKSLAQRALRGEIPVKQGLDQFGARVSAGMQARIASNIPPPLAPATIEAKGSSTALVDTGQVRASLTWQVRKVGSA